MNNAKHWPSKSPHRFHSCSGEAEQSTADRRWLSIYIPIVLYSELNLRLLTTLKRFGRFINLRWKWLETSKVIL